MPTHTPLQSLKHYVMTAERQLDRYSQIEDEAYALYASHGIQHPESEACRRDRIRHHLMIAIRLYYEFAFIKRWMVSNEQERSIIVASSMTRILDEYIKSKEVKRDREFVEQEIKRYEAQMINLTKDLLHLKSNTQGGPYNESINTKRLFETMRRKRD